MKIRKFTTFFCTVLLLFSFAAPVGASPNTQASGPQAESITRAFEATRQALGWNETDTDIIVGHPTQDAYPIVGSYLLEHSDGEIISVFVFASAQEAMDDLRDYQDLAAIFDEIESYTFHGQPAIYHTFDDGRTEALFVFDKFNIDATSNSAKAKGYLQTFYQKLAANGFFTGGVNIVEATGTVPVSSTITIKAYADNYGEITQTIDNSANFGSVDISGVVTSLETGAPIGGATIEVISGASFASTVSAADGSYSLTAVVPGGVEGGMVSGIDFVLPIKADLTIEVLPTLTELLANGTSSTDVVIQVKDLQGNPLKDRPFNLALDADAGPGSIQPAQASTDENGLIQAVYTAFKLAPGVDSSTTRHEVTITAHDNTTGAVGSNSIFVNQYQVTVLFGETIPACSKCNFPSKFNISVSDYWNNPIPNLPLTLSIAGGVSDATLVADPDSNLSRQELTLTTDSNGRAGAFFKWKGSLDIIEAIRQVVVVDGITNTQVTKTVNVHGLDIGIGRIEEAGFTGVTGQQAFFKIYFKDLAHPDLPLDRFNTDSPNKLGIRVSISQYESDGVNTSLTFEQTGGWEQDARGTFVKMYATPFMPYVIPVNNGTSWYEVRVDAVIDQDVYLPDLLRKNNDNIFALTTGTPDGWLHIWLQDGILTPHNWQGVVFKCVGRFLPGLGSAITIIDTLNQVYNQDVLGLGQSTAQVLTDALESKSKLLPQSDFLKQMEQTRASAVNNIVSCLQDSYAVYKEGTQQGSIRANGVLSLSPALLQSPVNLPLFDDADTRMVAVLSDRFVQGVLLDLPDQRGVVVYGLQASDVTMLNSLGKRVDPSSGEGDVLVFLLPLDGQFHLDVSSASPFSIAVYQAGSDDGNRKTFRQDVSTSTALKGGMDISTSSSFDLNLDTDLDGVADQTLQAQALNLDVVKPEITNLTPKQGGSLSAQNGSITASYVDNPGGVGIDVQAVRIMVDDVDLTSQADVQPGSLALPLAGLRAGEHSLMLAVSDQDGNAAYIERTFTIKTGLLSLIPFNNSLLLAAAIGIILVTIIVIIIVLLSSRKRRMKAVDTHQQASNDMARDDMVQDKQGTWWVQDPGSGRWSFWNGQSWQMVPQRSPGMAANTQPPIQEKRGGSCLLSLLVGAGIGIVVIGGLSLIGLHFFPAYHFTRGQGDLTQILKMGGGGLLIALLGLLLVNSGFKALITRRAMVEDDDGNRTEKRGCSAVLQGLGQLVIGIVFLAGGFGLMTMVFFQEVVPLLGF
jgi:hypothetical protein